MNFLFYFMSIYSLILNLKFLNIKYIPFLLIIFQKKKIESDEEDDDESEEESPRPTVTKGKAK